MHISLANGYGLKFVQPFRTMIYVVGLGRETIFLFYMVQVSKGRQCKNKKDAEYKRLYFMRANDLVLIKNHAILKKYDSI